MAVLKLERVWGRLMSDRPARRGPGPALDQVPLPVDVSVGLTLREETLRPGNGLPLHRRGRGGSAALTTFICLSERLWSAA